jgi:hypothetical protein
VNFHELLVSFYQQSVLVVNCGMAYAPAGYLTRLRDFLQENKPVNAVLLIST